MAEAENNVFRSNATSTENDINVITTEVMANDPKPDDLVEEEVFLLDAGGGLKDGVVAGASAACGVDAQSINPDYMAIAGLSLLSEASVHQIQEEFLHLTIRKQVSYRTRSHGAGNKKTFGADMATVSF